MFGLIILMLLVLGKNLSGAGPLSVLPTHAPFVFSWYAIYNAPKELGTNAFLSHYLIMLKHMNCHQSTVLTYGIGNFIWFNTTIFLNDQEEQRSECLENTSYL